MSDYKESPTDAVKKKGDATKTEGIRRNVIPIGAVKRRLAGFDFQCACCRELTKVTVRKPGKLNPTKLYGAKCRVCESESDLFIEKMKDGRIRVKTTECRPTEEGMKHYYMYNPEKDPDYVQPDGRQDNQNTDSETPDEAESTMREDLQDGDSSVSEQRSGISDQTDQYESEKI